MSKRNTIEYVCYNEECKHNDKGFCQLKGVKPNGCINAISKQGLELCIETKNSKIADLEAKLAESEKENAKLKQVVESIDKLKQYDLDMGDYCLISQKQAEQYFYDTNQDKIELLEKVRARYPRKTTMWSSDETEDGFEYVSDFIDTLIKEIKGE